MIARALYHCGEEKRLAHSQHGRVQIKLVDVASGAPHIELTLLVPIECQATCHLHRRRATTCLHQSNRWFMSEHARRIAKHVDHDAR